VARRRLIRLGIPASLGLHAAVAAGLGLLAGPTVRPDPPVLVAELAPAVTSDPQPSPAPPTPPAPAPPPRPPSTAIKPPPPRATSPSPRPVALPAPTPAAPPPGPADATPLVETPPPPPPPPSPTAPAAAAEPDAEARAYAQLVWERVLAHRPATRRLTGTTLVGFRLDSAGELLSAEIARSSGSALHDRAALAALRAAAPFPPPPPTIAPDRLAFTLPFVFH
jgi:protein TonB